MVYLTMTNAENNGVDILEISNTFAALGLFLVGIYLFIYSFYLYASNL